MKQLFANNAKTTLTVGISPTSTTLQVSDPSLFPIPAANEFFLVTLEVGSQIEIVKVSSVVGANLYVSSTADRGQEGTTALSFPAAARVEVRVTRDTLNSFSKALMPLNSVNQLVAPKDSYNTGYICASFDTYGNPAVAVLKDQYNWRFLTYTAVNSLVSTAGNTTTSLNVSAISLVGSAPGRLLVQITSGVYAGYVREMSSYTTTSVSWTVPLPGTPATGDTFEVLHSNSALLLETTTTTGDDAVLMALILGGN